DVCLRVDQIDADSTRVNDGVRNLAPATKVERRTDGVVVWCDSSGGLYCEVHKIYTARVRNNDHGLPCGVCQETLNRCRRVSDYGERNAFKVIDNHILVACTRDVKDVGFVDGEVRRRGGDGVSFVTLHFFVDDGRGESGLYSQQRKQKGQPK